MKIGSAGKIFNLTGWKVGFVCAAPALMRVLAKAHQFITFTTPPNLQSAVAYGLGKDDAYFEGMRADFTTSRDRFAAGPAGPRLRGHPEPGDLLPQHRHRPLGRERRRGLLQAPRRSTTASPRSRSAPSTPRAR